MDSGKTLLWLALLSLFALPCAVRIGYFLANKDRESNDQRLLRLATSLSLQPKPAAKAFLAVGLCSPGGLKPGRSAR